MPLFLAAQGLTPRQPRSGKRLDMVDIFALSLTHALMLLAVWRMLQRGDLDAEPAGEDGPRA
ncbi:MAG: hypothetical protein HOO94_03700 [Novosphingobium sp.]|uniref:hypothetical protein n=1 Tax=Novosphingobium sp. TaxID=1874826 RepID=UPI0017F4321C|nr:hypothetical protein [Novosphingobium sp.]